MRTLIPLSTLGAVLLLGAAASAVTIDLVPVGNAGNACDTQTQGCFGSVAYGYRISKYEVTNAQYAEFLNAVAITSDPNSLYNSSMGSGLGGITQTEDPPGVFTYTAITGRQNMPVNFVSFYDALRFVNWMHNGQLTGAQDATTTEDGAYTFNGPTTVSARNASATVVLPSEDEWYKAAYYDGVSTSYFDYPASSDTPPSCTAPTAAANSANCNFIVGDVTDIGSYTGSAGPYGTFDQGGNVYEWNESIDGSNRGRRGGAYSSTISPNNPLAASFRINVDPTFEFGNIGIRVAPEPGRNLFLFAGVLSVFGLAGWRRARA